MAADLAPTGLRVLVEVAQTGSFSAAARVLGYTQSAVSRQVAALEAAAGRALFERRAGAEHQADSAGTTPAEHLHPEVVEAMRELDIDLGGVKPKALARELAEWADVVVTMGCGDACPYIPGKRYIDWDLPDPKGLPLEQVREIRDDITRRVAGLVDLLSE